MLKNDSLMNWFVSYSPRLSSATYFEFGSQIEMVHLCELLSIVLAPTLIYSQGRLGDAMRQPIATFCAKTNGINVLHLCSIADIFLIVLALISRYKRVVFGAQPLFRFSGWKSSRSIVRWTFLYRKRLLPIWASFSNMYAWCQWLEFVPLALPIANFGLKLSPSIGLRIVQ